MINLQQAVADKKQVKFLNSNAVYRVSQDSKVNLAADL